MRFINIDALLSTLLVFVSMLIFPLIFSLSFFDPFEKALADFEITDVGFAELHDQKATKPDTNITLINTKGLKFSHYLQLLEILQDIEPEVIGIMKNINEFGSSVEQKRILSEKYNRKNIVVGYYNNIREKHEYTQAKIGYLNIFKDKDREYFTAREFMPKIRIDRGIEYSFAYSVINIYDKRKSKALIKRNNDNERIFFKGNLEKFFWYHAFDLLKKPDEFIHLKDQILLLGDFTPDKIPYKIDQGYYTPLNEENVGRTFTDMYPIVLQANIISMILKENYYKSLPVSITVVIAFLLCYFNMIIFKKINIKYKNWYEITSVLLFLIESIIILFMTVVLFHVYKFELNVTLTIFAIALSVFVYEGYQESVKPLTLKAINHIFKRK